VVSRLLPCHEQKFPANSHGHRFLRADHRQEQKRESDSGGAVGVHNSLLLQSEQSGLRKNVFIHCEIIIKSTLFLYFHGLIQKLKIIVTKQSKKALIFCKNKLITDNSLLPYNKETTRTSL